MFHVSALWVASSSPKSDTTCEGRSWPPATGSPESAWAGEGRRASKRRRGSSAAAECRARRRRVCVRARAPSAGRRKSLGRRAAESGREWRVGVSGEWA
eukprot:4529596-Prymnesium_polylepis.1